MDIYTILFLLMNITFWGYIFYILIKYGILPSVSDSYYKLPKKTIFKFPTIIPGKILFWVYALGFAIPAMIIGLTLSSGSNYQILMFFAALGIAFVGASPEFKNIKLEKNIHFGGAIIGVVCNTLFLLIVFTKYWYIPSTFILFAILLLISKMKNKIYYLELLSFITFSLTIGLVLFN